MKNQQEFNYHYKREDRLSMPNAPKINQDKSKNIFKKNKSLAVILIDIIIIVIVFALIKFFFITPSNIAENNGFELTLDGFSTNEKVIVSITMEKKESDAFSGTAEIIFLVEDKEIKIIGELPDLTGEKIEYTDTMEVAEKLEELKAHVNINDQISELSVNLNDK